MPTVNQQGEVLRLEVYEYAGAYGFKNRSDGDHLVRQRMEEIEAVGKHFEARGNDRYALPGRWFRLTGYFDTKSPDNDPDLEFLILGATHEVNNNYLQNGLPAVYRNALSCIHKKIPWRPGRSFNSAEPKIYGLQTAIVVGPKGEEIHTDEYGRIRVQFHWDRVGQYDQSSSAWIRVAQPWAGAGWGAIAIPRIGQEVVVQFLDGNPDRPLVTGCLFNERNMPPYALPGGSHMMGFKSNSSPGGGGYSEMVIHDAAGSELVNIHAQKDMVTTVLNDDSTTVHASQSTTVLGEKRSVKVPRGAQETTVEKQVKIVSSAGDVYIEAATSMTLKCGDSTIVLKPDGSITINGSKVKVMGSERVDINE